jgi:hypothetical protein
MSQDKLVEMAQTLGRIEGKLDSLTGPEGRITKIEKEQERQFWITVAIAPALAALHQLLRKFGVTV